MRRFWIVAVAAIVVSGFPSHLTMAQSVFPQGVLHCISYLTTTGAFWGDPNEHRWQQKNALWLCEKNQDLSSPPAPVKCFNQMMSTGRDWEQSIITCRTAGGGTASSPDEVAAQWLARSQQAANQQARNTATQPAGNVQAGGQQGISIAFTNGLNQAVDQFLFDAASNKYTHYYTLQPGETVDQPSSQGVQWAFSIGGNVQSTYTTTGTARQTFVVGSAAPAQQPAAPQTPAQPQQPAVAQVNGTNLQMAEFSGGAFVKLGGNYWGEISKKDWKVVFAFEEKARTAGGVRLQSPKDKKHILLNLVDKKVYYGYDNDGGPTRPLYNITGMDAQARVPGSSIPWDAMDPPASTLPQQVAATNTGQTGGSGGSGATGNVPKSAFDPDAYTVANKRCRRQDAKLGPGERTMTQILGVCHPVKTNTNTGHEFIVDYRSEVLSWTVTVDRARGTKLKLINKPAWQAWVDSQGDIHLAMSTHNNSISIENSSRTSQRRGPFLRTMDVTVSPGMPIEGVQTFPQNGMGSSFASRSRGLTLGASVGANAGHPMATGVNASLNASYSDTTTASWTLDEYRVIVKSGNNGQRTFSWSLCAWASLTECYKGGTDLLERGFLGGLESDLIKLPNSAFRMDNFKSDVYYVINRKDHLQTLKNTYFLVQFDYNIRLNTVRPWSDNGGFTRYGKTTGGNLTYRMLYHVDLRELASIVLDNPEYFDAGSVARQ